MTFNIIELVFKYGPIVWDIFNSMEKNQDPVIKKKDLKMLLALINNYPICEKYCDTCLEEMDIKYV